jgi:hypothetical protein
LPPITLPSGAIVEEPTPEQLRHLPPQICMHFSVDAGGKPLPIEAPLEPGASIEYLGMSGLYLLPSGRISAVYGCWAEPITGPSDERQ